MTAPQVHTVITTERNPRKNDPDDTGQVAYGSFTVTGNTLTLLSINGEPIEGGPKAKRLEPGEDPRQAAARLIRQIRGRRKADFNRPLRLPTWGVA